MALGSILSQSSHMSLIADWEKELEAIFVRGLESWSAGHRTPETLFSEADQFFLGRVGCSPRELFDFVEDCLLYGEPLFPEILEIQRLRYEYFVTVQGGENSGKRATMASLPPKSEAVEGISWLPRLIVKARLKLRGEMPDDLMYGCGGDRPFVRQMKTTLSGFLRLVGDSGEDNRRIVATVKEGAHR